MADPYSHTSAYNGLGSCYIVISLALACTLPLVRHTEGSFFAKVRVVLPTLCVLALSAYLAFLQFLSASLATPVASLDEFKQQQQTLSNYRAVYTLLAAFSAAVLALPALGAAAQRLVPRALAALLVQRTSLPPGAPLAAFICLTGITCMALNVQEFSLILASPDFSNSGLPTAFSCTVPTDLPSPPGEASPPLVLSTTSYDVAVIVLELGAAALLAGGMALDLLQGGVSAGALQRLVSALPSVSALLLTLADPLSAISSIATYCVRSPPFLSHTLFSLAIFTTRTRATRRTQNNVYDPHSAKYFNTLQGVYHALLIGGLLAALAGALARHWQGREEGAGVAYMALAKHDEGQQQLYIAAAEPTYP